MSRGGSQHIPRPPQIRPGDLPPWDGLDLHIREWSIDQVVAAMGAAPPPMRDNPFTPSPVRASAVLVGLFEDAGRVRVAFIKRPGHSTTHAGEVAFPGGKFEEGTDSDLQATALREASEEIGLDPSTVTVLAELDTGATVVSGFTIAPFVAVIEAPEGGWKTDPNEVAAMVCPSLAELFRPEVYRQERWDIPPSPQWQVGVQHHPMHFFDLAGETVWGATARVLCDFLCVVAGLPPLGYDLGNAEHRVEPWDEKP